MIPTKNSLTTLSVLVFGFAYGVSSTLGDVPKTFSAENPEAARVRVEDVSQYSQVFLSGMKTSPAIDMGNGMTFRLEVEEPSNDDKTMNAARKAIGETPAVMDSARRKLAALLKNDSELNVPWDNDAWIIRFLRLRNYDVPKAYKLIKSYYNFKTKNGVLYDNLTPSQMKEVAGQGVVEMLPNRDPAGNRIMVARSKQWDPKKYPLLQLLKLAMVLSETGAYEPATQLTGAQIIFDAEGLTWQHVKQFNPTIAKLIVQWILTSAPIRVQGIQIFNESRIFWALFNIFKPFLTEELRNKIHFHGTNMKSLYRYVPASSLPVTLGGSMPKAGFSSYEWGLLLESGDEEFAKIASYGLKRKV